jgi:hypothetical protein
LVFFLRENPVERIGYQKGGIADIQKHKSILSFSSNYEFHISFFLDGLKDLVGNV